MIPWKTVQIRGMDLKTIQIREIGFACNLKRYLLNNERNEFTPFNIHFKDRNKDFSDIWYDRIG